MNTLNVGDVVQLKSGGPKMTVETIYEDATGTAACTCMWFTKDRMQRAGFIQASLEVVVK